jgi:hypothetical protein
MTSDTLPNSSVPLVERVEVPDRCHGKDTALIEFNERAKTLSRSKRAVVVSCLVIMLATAIYLVRYDR